jgi:two-component system OmpR family response regulator
MAMNLPGRGDGHPVRIMVVEDDADIRDMLQRYLHSLGYAVAVAGDGVAAYRMMQAQSFDLILLDLMLPAGNGFDLCRRIRKTSDLRIIIVTARAEVADRVAGLELGADDYIGKPFELAEMAARIRAVLRRGVPRETMSESGLRPDALSFAGWRFEPERRLLYANGRVRVALTGAETDLLLVFCGNPSRILSREELLDLSRRDDRAIEERTVDLTVSRLRRKLASGGRQLELIRTIRGNGYIFDPAFGYPESTSL